MSISANTTARKVITVYFEPEFLNEIDNHARAAGFGRRNDYIKAVLRADIKANKVKRDKKKLLPRNRAV